MKKRIFQCAGAGLGLLLLAGLIVPYVNADQYGLRLKWSLQKALGRQVDIGKVRFSLLEGPAFSVERDSRGPGVVIHEDPSIGIEPIAYVESMRVRPSLWSLLGGRFVIASIRLEDASINLSKTGPASEPGLWNFSSFVNPSVMSAAPAIHVRNGRVHFKFGDTKSVFYLTATDLDISPPGSRGGGWTVSCSAQPARSDRAAQGLGSFTLSGRWYVAPERVDLDLDVERTGLGELTALLRGQAGSIHGTATAQLHLGGPINNIGIQGRLNVEDVHRWDLLPPHGQGWPLDVRGRLDLIGQQLELQSSSAGGGILPLSARLRASDYLSKPHWAVAVNWNRFPIDPLMQLAADMGAQFPPRLKLSGTMDGAIGYSGAGSFQGELAFHDTAVTIPDSPPVRFDQAYVVFDHGHVHLSPARVHTAEQDEAEIQADYAIDADTLDLAIHTEAMKVGSLRAQVALAAVPWLEQVQSGEWSGDLHYHREPAQAGWTGQLQLTGARVAVPGLAHPVELASARAQIDGVRVVLDRLDAATGGISFGGDYRYEPGAARPASLPPARRDARCRGDRDRADADPAAQQQPVRPRPGPDRNARLAQTAGRRRRHPDRRPQSGRPAPGGRPRPPVVGRRARRAGQPAGEAQPRLGRRQAGGEPARGAPGLPVHGQAERHGLAIGQARCRRNPRIVRGREAVAG